jgi:hypothetical protein
VDATLDERTILSIHVLPAALVRSTPDSEDAQAFHYAAQVQLRVPADGRLNHSGDAPPLVGIEHASRPNSYIRCTKIDAALEILARANERRRPALRVRI